MYEFLQQYNPEFPSLLNNLRMENVCDNDVDFILNSCLDKMYDETRHQFQQDYINIVPTCKMSHMITYIYIDSFDTPSDKTKTRLEYPRTNGINHCIKELSMQLLNAICIGSVVMLLRNCIFEYNLIHGSIGIVKNIVYM